MTRAGAPRRGHQQCRSAGKVKLGVVGKDGRAVRRNKIGGGNHAARERTGPAGIPLPLPFQKDESGAIRVIPIRYPVESASAIALELQAQ